MNGMDRVSESEREYLEGYRETMGLD